MREIKFRYTFKRKSDGHIYQLIIPIGCLEDGYGEIFEMLRNELWELIGRDEYTGLKDENGTEIYEENRVSILWDDIGIQTEEEGVVYWDNVHAGFYVEYDPDSSVPISSADILEVTGNIYSDPELVNGQS